MFIFHTALSLCLLALVAGSALYMSAARCEAKGSCFAKFISVIVIILSIISTVCTIYCGVKMCKQGGDQCPMYMGMMHDKNAQDKSSTTGDNAAPATQTKTGSSTHKR